LHSLCVILDDARISWSCVPDNLKCEDLPSFVKEGHLQSLSSSKEWHDDVQLADMVLILFNTPIYTLIDERDHYSILEKNINPISGKAGTEQFDMDALLQFGARGAYRVQLPEELAIHLMPDATKTEHYITHLIRELGMRSGLDGVHLRFGASRILIVVVEENKLLFCNQFDFQTSEEVIYFTLLAYEMTNSSTGTIPLYLYGQIEEDSSIYSNLRKYFKNVYFYSSPECLLPKYHKYWDHLSVHRKLRIEYAHH